MNLLFCTGKALKWTYVSAHWMDQVFLRAWGGNMALMLCDPAQTGPHHHWPDVHWNSLVPVQRQSHHSENIQSNNADTHSKITLAVSEEPLSSRFCHHLKVLLQWAELRTLHTNHNSRCQRTWRWSRSIWSSSWCSDTTRPPLVWLWFWFNTDSVSKLATNSNLCRVDQCIFLGPIQEYKANERLASTAAIAMATTGYVLGFRPLPSLGTNEA